MDLFNSNLIFIQKMADLYHALWIQVVQLTMIFLISVQSTTNTTADRIQALEEHVICIQNTLDSMGISSSPRGKP